jgi:hypothetical protein
MGRSILLIALKARTRTGEGATRGIVTELNPNWKRPNPEGSARAPATLQYGTSSRSEAEPSSFLACCPLNAPEVFLSCSAFFTLHFSLYASHS